MSQLHKEIGKIQSAKFGFGGYQDAQIGLTIQLGSDKDGWGTVDFKGYWAIKRSEGAEWTEEIRQRSLGITVMELADILRKAKKNNVTELVGVPIEATFNSPFGRLVSWRILEEVI